MKIIVLHNDIKREVDAEIGLSLMEVLKKRGFYVPASCGGSMACSTCQVIIGAQWYEHIPAPTEDEEDVLDMIPQLTTTTRLSCQIICNEALNGLEVTLPKEVTSLLSR